MDQRPKQSETHSSTFPQDSDSDSESEIELRSTHTSPETTTSDESDETLVDTSTSTTPTPSLSGEGDSTKGHSQLSVGTLPLTDNNPPKDPKEKNPPPGPSVERPTSDFSEDNPGNPPRNAETVTTPPSKELEHVVDTPPSQQRKDSPSGYPPQDHPEAPPDSEEGLALPPSKISQSVHPDDPFSRFWSGQTADTSGKSKKRYRWLTRKPEKRHSVELEALDEQDHRPYRYVLRRNRPLFPRPKFHSKCPSAEGASLEYAEFILQHIVLQRLREKEEEKLEHEKRESEIRRQSELPTDLTDKLRRLIPVDAIISPFHSGEDKTPGEDIPLTGLLFGNQKGSGKVLLNYICLEFIHVSLRGTPPWIPNHQYLPTKMAHSQVQVDKYP